MLAMDQEAFPASHIRALLMAVGKPLWKLSESSSQKELKEQYAPRRLCTHAALERKTILSTPGTMVDLECAHKRSVELVTSRGP